MGLKMGCNWTDSVVWCIQYVCWFLNKFDCNFGGYNRLYWALLLKKYFTLISRFQLILESRFYTFIPESQTLKNKEYLSSISSLLLTKHSWYFHNCPIFFNIYPFLFLQSSLSSV
jgi:hypothetical protein